VTLKFGLRVAQDRWMTDPYRLLPQGVEKCGHPTVEKVWRYDYYLFWCNTRTWQTAGQTDRQTPRNGIGRGMQPSCSRAATCRPSNQRSLFTCGRSAVVRQTSFVCQLANVQSVLVESAATHSWTKLASSLVSCRRDAAICCFYRLRNFALFSR